jgi:hypothetical protein
MRSKAARSLPLPDPQIATGHVDSHPCAHVGLRGWPVGPAVLSGPARLWGKGRVQLQVGPGRAWMRG